jgi:hypothetical protein
MRRNRRAPGTFQLTSPRRKIIREEEKAARKAVGVKKGKAIAGSSREKRPARVAVEEDETDPEETCWKLAKFFIWVEFG